MARPLTVPVLLAPAVDPGQLRRDLELPAGLTVREIVAAAMPGAGAGTIEHTTVRLVTPAGRWTVRYENWHTVRPRPGVHVVIRVTPGKGGLRSILQIVVSIAAIAIGQLWAASTLAAGLSSAAISIGKGLITLGVTAIGGLLINALVPPTTPGEQDKDKPSYCISGWKNPMTPDGFVPLPLGRHRYAPPFAAQSYSEVVGDDQYIRALFLFGYGPLAIPIDSLKVGDTLFGKYDKLEYELRLGLPGDLPVTLYPQQVIEESAGVEMRYERPKDDYGEEIGGAAFEEKPVSRFTASDAAEAAVIVGFPSGLAQMDDDGGTSPYSITFRLRQRLEGQGAWATVEAGLEFRGERRESFFRAHRWALPSRGRWEIEITRISANSDSGKKIDRTVLVAVQSFRPEYPVNFDKPVALLAVRVKATYQLNGPLDSVNALPSRVCPDWDTATGTWITRETRNPASLFRYMLQTPANAFPQPDSAIDLVALADWHDFCRIKGLKFDRIYDSDIRLQEVLSAIAAAGRASPRHDGRKWSVVIDRPQTIAVDHISSRNSRAFNWRKVYARFPDAFRVRFADATNAFEGAERVVPWPGHTGSIELTEELSLPGKTDPAEVWREARRRQYELIHRPVQYSAVQDGAARVATRGDLVMASWDAIAQRQKSARVKAVREALIELDDFVTMEAGQAYAISWQEGITEANPVGQAVVRGVATVAGETKAVRLTGSGDSPARDDIVHFGLASSVSRPQIVREVEAGERLSATLSLIDAAPIVDELTDAEVPPAWNGRVGAPIDQSALVPAVPIVVGVDNSKASGGATGSLVVRLVPGTGSSATVKTFEARHRLVGASSWTTVSKPASQGAVPLAGYAVGNQVEFQPRAVSAADTPSAWGTTRTVTVGAKDIPLPLALAAFTATGGVGGVKLTVATRDDPNITAVAIYKLARGAAFDPSANPQTGRIRTLDPGPLSSGDHVYGDVTLTNLATNGGMDTDTGWTKGTGWTIASGKANKTAGAQSELQQAVTLPAAGTVLRWSFRVSASPAGYVFPRLMGGGDVNGPVQAGNGFKSGTLTVGSGNNVFAFTAFDAFSGSIDDAALYVSSASAAQQGDFDFYAVPFNADGQRGPISGPLALTIR